MERFADRPDAGRLLGVRLSVCRGDETIVVLGLPRGGAVVAYEVASLLKAPLDVVVVRKVGAPFQPELAMGALAEGGVTIRMGEVHLGLHISEEEFSRAASNEESELERRVRQYRHRCRALDLVGRTVMVVDDGIATGATARAAVASVRARGAARVVMAVPVASAEAVEELARIVDNLVVLVTVHGPSSVGSYYERFEQTSDREVMECLSRARRVGTAASSASSRPDVAERPKKSKMHRRRLT